MGDISALLIVGSAVIIAFLGGRLVNRFRLPMVIGYIIVGVILGKSGFNILNSQMVNSVRLLNDLALGIIAFLIGGELHFSRLRALGGSIFIIAICESIGAFLMVSVFSYLLIKKLYISLILGAIASATAPAATVAVLNQYQAKGPLTTTILGVVGSDDAIALIIYAFAASFARLFISSQPLSLISTILSPLREVFLSLVIGGMLGGFLGYFLKKIRSRNEAFALFLGIFLLAEGIALQFDLSELLLIMALAIVGVNIAYRRFSQVMDTLNTVGFPIIAAFFCLAGTRLNIHLLPQMGLLGLVYLFSRFGGKYGGAMLGGRLSRAPEVVRKYVGFSLLPQIGVAVALAIVVEKDFGSLGKSGRDLALMAMNILLFTTIFTEVIGPIMTKWALIKAGEAGRERKRR